MSLVSIVIPCYNQAHFLANTLTSVLGQTYDELEVIVIDDGSNDDLTTVLASFANDARVRCIHQERQGLPAARNAGIRASSGVYLSFLDADDWFAPTKIEAQVAVLDAEPETAFVYCDIERVYEQVPIEGQYNVGTARKQYEGDIFESLLRGGYFPPHAVLIRRLVLDSIGLFDEALGGYADWELWTRIAASGYRAAFIDQQLAFYRVHANSMSKDTEHMRLVRGQAMQSIVRRFPDRTAAALFEITTFVEEADAANRWLSNHMQELLSQIADGNKQTAELRSWIEQLETGKAWLEQQWQNLSDEVHRQQAVITELTAWTQELERGKAWLEEQLAMQQAIEPEAPK